MKFLGLFDPVNAKRVKREAGEPLQKEPPTEIRRTFARNVREARETVGLSQRELAKLAGVSQRYLWLIETEAMNVTLDVVTGLSKHLGKTEIELLSPKRGS